ncbi:MAG TPA: ATPase, T2SS/T4P/T4SS family, partial [archaeon]|nr:ATPase, T2SS/T4P/T4SS family [archaeon]
VNRRLPRVANGLHGGIYKSSGGLFYCIESVPEVSPEEQGFVSQLCFELSEALRSFPNAGSDKVDELLSGLCSEICADLGISLDAPQEKYLLEVAKMTALGFGPLEFFLEDEELEEVALAGNAPLTRVFAFHSRLGWLKTNVVVHDSDFAVSLANKLASQLGRRLTLSKPTLNASLPNGSRLHAAIPPVSFSGPSLTVRKFKKNPVTPPELASSKVLSFDALAFLWLALEGEANVLIAGNTGSGKTTTLNSLFCFVPRSERVVLVEETPEVNVLNEQKVRLLVNEDLGVSMNSLILDTMRMRPDRVVVGEVRSAEEMKSFILTALSGQGKGALATMHAQSSQEALSRLAGAGVPSRDLESIDLVVVQRRWSARSGNSFRELRRVVQVSEVAPGPSVDSFPEARDVFSFDFSRGRLKKNYSKSLTISRHCQRNNVSRKAVLIELGKRSRFLEALSRKKKRFHQVAEAIESFK